MTFAPFGVTFSTLGKLFVCKNRLRSQRLPKWRQPQNLLTLLELIFGVIFRSLSFSGQLPESLGKEFEKYAFLDRVQPRKLSPRIGESTISKF